MIDNELFEYPDISNISNSNIKNYLKSIDKGLEKKKQPPALAFQDQLGKLIHSFEGKDLTLVVGAGISADYDLPDWNTLLQELISNLSENNGEPQSGEVSYLISRIYTELFPGNSLITARYLNQIFQEQNPDAELKFERKVREMLYENIVEDWNSPLVEEIVYACLEKEGDLDSIITFNYDDILEEACENIRGNNRAKVKYNSVYHDAIKPKKDTLSIYHVHGFLPREKRITYKNKITLSENVYHDQYHNTYSWNNIVQINKYRDKTCLFIGLSFTDPNLRRLLDISVTQKGDYIEEDYHFVIKKRYDRQNTLRKIRGILELNPDIINPKPETRLSLEEVNHQLVDLIETFEENDAKSFGISTIWIEDFNQIPSILKAIRNKNREFTLT